MYTYGFVLLLILFLYFVKRYVFVGSNQEFVIDLVVFLILCGFSANSFSNGWDWHVYHQRYLLISPLSFSDMISLNLFGDYGYRVFTWLISQIAEDYQFVILTQSIIINGMFFTAFRKLKVDYTLFAVIFFSTSYLKLELSTFRQGISVAMFFLAISYRFIDGKRWTPLLILISAVFMHASAVFAIFVYIFMTKVLITKKKLLYISFFAMFFIFFNMYVNIFHLLYSLVSHFIPQRLDISLSTYASKINVRPSFFSFILIFQSFILYFIYKPNDNISRICASLIVVNLFLFFYFSFVPNIILSRLYYYSSFSLVFLLCKLSENKGSSGIQFYFIIVLVSIGSLLATLRDPLERNVYTPYESYIGIEVFNYPLIKTKSYIQTNLDQID